MKTHPLNGFGEQWVVDGDLVRCRRCQRGQHASMAGTLFQHASWCSRKDEEARPWFELHALVTEQLSLIAPKDEARAAHNETSGMVPLFTRSLPDGMDDATYSAVEAELDRAEAPLRNADGGWLRLHERVAALAKRMAQSTENGGGSNDESVEPTP